jgi:hypothetical protein
MPTASAFRAGLVPILRRPLQNRAPRPRLGQRTPKSMEEPATYRSKSDTPFQAPHIWGYFEH